MNVYGIKIKKFYRIFLTLRVHEKDYILRRDIRSKIKNEIYYSIILKY